MKTINVMMASFAALLIAGCSQNEVTEVSPDAHPQMKFGVYTGTPTRGVDTDNTSIKDDPTDANKYGGFGIMGYYTGGKTWEEAKASTAPGFMHNQMVKWDGTLNSNTGGWTYEPVKYWPNNKNDKISFFAYAPFEDKWSSGDKTGVTVCDATTQGIPYIKFKMKEGDELPKMVDLVVASATDKTYDNSKSGVTFNFEHTLSRISFQAKLGDGIYSSLDGTDGFVFITEMWIVGSNHGTTAAEGNMSLIDASAQSNPNSKFYTTATWKELHWNYGTTGATPEAIIPAKDFNLKPMLKKTDGSITESNPTTGHSTTVSGVKITDASQGTPVSLFPDKQYLYLIPVGDNGADATKSGCAVGDIWFGFHYDIVTPDKTHSNQYIASHAESVVKIPAGHLQRKKTYQYTLVINLHEITIADAKVGDWGTEVTESPVE
ncbi:fimbrillin family protein [Bacteroides oleiciplenus]|uniref:Fimbrillin family protein n=1 Tax=Bacteroides oleiciplenus YIT 12058 TaxID=742727 RepID=K9EHU7_9BACE|nr:fimbrillin family protein [Bacteroides oleiciplenus]EKU88735.1 hypothetical protein HMPREF9447_04053 [Bacteroides oleiciplenus YIT 12058]